MTTSFSSLFASLPSQPHLSEWGTETAGKLDGLEGLPIEIILDIYQQLDVCSIFSLGQVNTLFHGLLKRNKAAILLPVLQREFSPFTELLQIYTASEQDLSQYGDTFQPRRVVFRRFPGDLTGVILSRGGVHTNYAPFSEHVLFTGSLSNGKPPSTNVLPAPRSVALVDRDLDSMLRHCLVVRRWEELYPQLHWFSTPEDCRQLDDSEKFKLRRALYRWWLYAFYFHGELPRPRSGGPEPFVNDVRTSQMRFHPTRELMEMKDLFTSVKILVRHYVYPNLEQNLEPLQHISPLDSMIEKTIQERIVDTYAKLDPRDLMFYFENLFSYPRKRLVTDVNLKHPNFSRDQESLGAAIQSALDERPWLDDVANLNSVGSIVNNDNDCKDRLNCDGSHDGTVPPPGALQRPQNDWAPPGDDGRTLAERYQFYQIAQNDLDDSLD
ncbi:F-box domain protein [Colletotrichum truncatum]|uniref:F-box domain protein n=1 Tax=Colletotrichum truncatum TaxID=5467 RepID=A0ACC3Z969_COLTU|nr:F-box domain protein [Colletotrichum truncatum]KAF6793553.1 F-box domain protein [Colletotrichum truncatum]